MNFQKSKENVSQFLGSQQYILLPLLLIITLILTIVLYPDLLSTERTYRKGDIVDVDIKAPADFYIRDIPATEINRKVASGSVLTVYDYDADLVHHLVKKVNDAFKIPRDIIQIHHDEVRAQDEWRRKVEEEKAQSEISGVPSAMQPDSNVSTEFTIEPLSEKLQNVKAAFKDKIGLPVNADSYAVLVRNEFSRKMAGQIETVLTTIMDNGIVANKNILLSEVEKGITLRTLSSNTSINHKETIETGLKKIYGLPQSKLMVRIICQKLFTDLNASEKNLIVDYVQRLISPNITLNIKETEKRREISAEETKPVLYKIKAGEMILREGERVTESHIIKLNEIESIHKKSNYYLNSSGTALVVLLFLIVTYTLHFKNQFIMNRMQNKNIFFISCILILLLLLAKVSTPFAIRLTPNLPFSVAESSFFFGIPLAAGSMIICIFLGLRIAIPFSLVLSVFTALIFHNNFEIFIFFILSSSMAAYWTQSCKERKVFIKAGFKLAILNVLIAVSINVYMAEMLGSKILSDSLFAFSGGLLAGIITAGLTPLVELVFGFTTDIKLLELANLDQPILRRLMIEAPGSYNHSVIVGTMAEAAASAIGANPLLARVSGYYHDIGKIKKPLYFIENQMHGKNRHDKLAPSMSALILIGHIKDGVEMSKKHKLGKEITSAIRQHHGTSVISYFYEKAKQNKGDGEQVNVNDFRYPGPRPQTRENAIVMLADVVEAASRTLDNPTSARIQGLVQNLINKIFSDGQLNNCDLTLKDLNIIAKSFNQLLTGIHHHRIKYIETPAKGVSGNIKNGHSDKEQAKQSKPKETKGSGKNEGHLKRLGLS